MVKKLIKAKKPSLTSSDVALFALRIALGWFFLYAGFEKFVTPGWTAAGFLAGAKTFPAFYGWFGSAANITWVNLAVTWGEILIGLGLIFGTFTRLASYFGILLLLLFYFPGLKFPLVKNGFIVDSNFLEILIFGVLISTRAGAIWGLDALINKKVKNWLV
jgi:thiosulfate dehydrogenase [quinone] large subunit